MRCYRRDLVTPKDTLYQFRDRVLLKIPSPKSSLRGGAHIQHVTIRGSEFLRLILAALEALPMDVPIFNLSNSAFGARWRFIMRMLLIPKPMWYTPACLRAGGAVAMYLTDTPIPELQWRMRLAGQGTLAHYLQEVTATLSLRQLPSQSRDRIVFLGRAYEELQLKLQVDADF